MPAQNAWLTYARPTSGFSVIELAAVMLLMGLLIVPFYKALIQAIGLDTSENKIQLIQSGLAEFVRINGRFPCPAVLGAAPGAANYARETAPPGTCAGTIVTPGATGGNVYIGAVPIDDLRAMTSCVDDPTNVAAAGTNPTLAALPVEARQTLRGVLYSIRDRIDVATGVNAANGQGFIQNGGNLVRYNKLDATPCLSNDDIVDERGDKFLYAVTDVATNLNTYDPFNPAQGQIRIVDENNNASTARDAVFALVSFGRNNNGAFNARGIALPCGAGLEAENCDNDSTFRDMPATDIAANFYDDTISFSLAGSLREKDMWRWANGGAGRNMLFNSLPGAAAGFSPRVLVDPPATLAQRNAIQATDSLVVNNGDLRGSQDIKINKAGAVGGDANAGGDVKAVNTIEAKTAVFGRKFCYKPPLNPGAGC